MTFEFGKRYIVDVTERGITPLMVFDRDRWHDKDHDDLDFLTDEEKIVVINDVLEKVRAEIVQMNDDVSKMLMPFDSIEKVKYTTGFIDGLGSTLDVIDKYREGGAE